MFIEQRVDARRAGEYHRAQTNNQTEAGLHITNDTETEKSVLLVKPEAAKFCTALSLALISSGFTVGQRIRVAQLDAHDTERLIALLYPRHCAAFLKAARDHYWNKPIAWFLVEAPDARTRLAQLVGECVDPAHCAEGSLRRMFGKPDPFTLNDPERGLNFNYYLNGCSCPRSAAEVRQWFASGLFFSNARAA